MNKRKILKLNWRTWKISKRMKICDIYLELDRYLCTCLCVYLLSNVFLLFLLLLISLFFLSFPSSSFPSFSSSSSLLPSLSLLHHHLHHHLFIHKIQRGLRSKISQWQGCWKKKWTYEVVKRIQNEGKDKPLV